MDYKQWNLIRKQISISVCTLQKGQDWSDNRSFWYSLFSRIDENENKTTYHAYKNILPSYCLFLSLSLFFSLPASLSLSLPLSLSQLEPFIFLTLSTYAHSLYITPPFLCPLSLSLSLSLSPCLFVSPSIPFFCFPLFAFSFSLSCRFSESHFFLSNHLFSPSLFLLSPSSFVVFLLAYLFLSFFSSLFLSLFLSFRLLLSVFHSLLFSFHTFSVYTSYSVSFFSLSLSIYIFSFFYLFIALFVSQSLSLSFSLCLHLSFPLFLSLSFSHFLPAFLLHSLIPQLSFISSLPIFHFYCPSFITFLPL